MSQYNIVELPDLFGLGDRNANRSRFIQDCGKRPLGYVSFNSTFLQLLGSFSAFAFAAIRPETSFLIGSETDATGCLAEISGRGVVEVAGAVGTLLLAPVGGGSGVVCTGPIGAAAPGGTGCRLISLAWQACHIEGNSSAMMAFRSIHQFCQWAWAVLTNSAPTLTWYCSGGDSVL